MRLREGLRLPRGPARIRTVRRRRAPPSCRRRPERRTARSRHHHARPARPCEPPASHHARTERSPGRSARRAPRHLRRRTRATANRRGVIRAPRRSSAGPGPILLRSVRLKPCCVPGRDRAGYVPGGDPARCDPARAVPARDPARTTTNGPPVWATRSQINRRRPTLPGPCGPSTIGAEGLNCSVRKGKRCFPLAIATGNR
jgi:hypothetical protein